MTRDEKAKGLKGLKSRNEKTHTSLQNGKGLSISTFAIFSLTVPVARFELLILGLRVKCSTTVLPLLAYSRITFTIFSLPMPLLGFELMILGL